MVRLILLGVAAFLVALGTVTGAMLLQHRGAAGVVATVVEADPAESVEPDEPEPMAGRVSTPADSVADRHGEGAGEGPPASPDAPAQAAVAPATEPAATGTPVAGAQPTNGFQLVGGATANTAASVSPAPPFAEGRLGKIFGSMQAKEAARVLEQMDDGDVIAILAMLNDRQAAAVLASLPPQRAAGISRLGFRAGRHAP